MDATAWLPPSYAIATGFHAGDLVLRPDHTYRRAYAPTGTFGNLGSEDAGTWQQSGSAFTLQPAGGGAVEYGVIAGDSVHLTHPDGTTGSRFFRADLTGASLPAGAWVLRSINGRIADASGIVADDEPLNGGRFVTRVQYDTLVFSDGVFARNAWAGTTTYTPASGQPQVASQSYQTDAVYNATAAIVTIQYVWYASKTSARSTVYRDTLSVHGDTLIRSLALTTGPFEERYVRPR